MESKNGLAVILGACGVVGCSSSDSKQPPSSGDNGASGEGSSSGASSGSTSSGNGSSGSGGGSGGQSSGASSGSSTPPPAGLMTGTADGGSPMTAQACDTMMASASLSADLDIPSGKTVCVGPGVTVTATSNITIQVEG